MLMRRTEFGAAALGALLLAASPAAAAPRTYVIVMEKMKFGPVPADLHKGDTVVWWNKDFLRHTATAADKSFNVDLPAGAKAKMTITKTGTFPFVCRYHPGMRGTLQIK